MSERKDDNQDEIIISDSAGRETSSAPQGGEHTCVSEELTVAIDVIKHSLVENIPAMPSTVLVPNVGISNITENPTGESEKQAADKTDQIPNFEHNDLVRQGDNFLTELQQSLPQRKSAEIDNMRELLLSALDQISTLSKELKETKLELTDTQKNNLRSALSEIEAREEHSALFSDIEQIWDNLITQLIDILQLLKTHEMSAIGTISSAGDFHINYSMVKRLTKLLLTMVESYTKHFIHLWKHVNQKKLTHVRTKKTELINELSKKYALNFVNSEDLADTEIDTMSLNTLLVSTQSPDKCDDITDNIIMLVHLHFYHLRNSLASQKAMPLTTYLEDLEDNMETSEYYEQNSDVALFTSEAAASTFLLSVLYRTMVVMTHTNKIRQIAALRHK